MLNVEHNMMQCQSRMSHDVPPLITGEQVLFLGSTHGSLHGSSHGLVGGLWQLLAKGT